MTDNLYFGRDTTEERFINERNQRSFIKELKQVLPDAIVYDAYSPTLGFRINVFIEDVQKHSYYSWLLSTDWYSNSETLNELQKDDAGQSLLKSCISLSMYQYPESYSEERLKKLPI